MSEGRSTTPRLMDVAPGASFSRRKPPEGRTDLAGWLQECSEKHVPQVQRFGAAALLHIDGPLMVESAWLYDGYECYTHTAIVRSLDAILADASISTLALNLQCPGWGVEGSSDTVTALKRFRSQKRLVAIVHDMAASGGQWMSALCEEVAITPTGWIGSIGSVMVLYDESKLFAEMGIVPKLVRDPAGKGEGTPGTEISADYLASLQPIAEQHVDHWCADIKETRGLDAATVRALNARMYSPADALKAGLVDRIETFEAFAARVSVLPPRAGPPRLGRTPPTPSAPTTPTPAPKATPAPITRKDRTMELKDATLADLKTHAPQLVAQLDQEAAARANQPATFQQLKAAFPAEADKSFITDCLEGNLTIQAAHTKHAKHMADQVKAATDRATAAETKAADLEKKVKGGDGGVDPLNANGAPGGGGGNTKYEDLVRQAKAAGLKDVQAHQKVMAEHKAAHRDWIERGAPRI